MLTNKMLYSELTNRNGGYVSPELQNKIKNTTLLIAGCGMGSGAAICAARLGFEKFILVDGDIIVSSNLNRQFFNMKDVGEYKVVALKKHIEEINPEAKVFALAENLGKDNMVNIVSKTDIVFDTVDFIDLPAILNLHSVAHTLEKPVFTALNVGFGAICWYFPKDTLYPLPKILDEDFTAASAELSTGAPMYAAVFARFFQRLVPYLDADVIADVGRVFAAMKDARPCPASQVAPGSFTVAAMTMSMIIDMLNGKTIVASPSLLAHSFRTYQTTEINLHRKEMLCANIFAKP